MWKGENIFSASQTACLNQGLLPEALVPPSASSEVLLSSWPCGSGTRGEETKAQGPEAQHRGLLVSCLVVVQPSEPTRLVTGCLPALPVPPSIENEDLEEAIKVPEGQTAHLTCNATGKATPGGWE